MNVQLRIPVMKMQHVKTLLVPFHAHVMLGSLVMVLRVRISMNVQRDSILVVRMPLAQIVHLDLVAHVQLDLKAMV